MPEISFLTPQPLKNKKAIRLPLWLLKMKKPWGFNGHPWLPIPPSGSDLWVTLAKIKIEKVKVKHFPYLADYCKNKGAYLSREILATDSNQVLAFRTGRNLPPRVTSKG
jgi:hypothetical protein